MQQKWIGRSEGAFIEFDIARPQRTVLRVFHDPPRHDFSAPASAPLPPITR